MDEEIKDKNSSDFQKVIVKNSFYFLEYIGKLPYSKRRAKLFEGIMSRSKVKKEVNFSMDKKRQMLMRLNFTGTSKNEENMFLKKLDIMEIEEFIEKDVNDMTIHLVVSSISLEKSKSNVLKAQKVADNVKLQYFSDVVKLIDFRRSISTFKEKLKICGKLILI